MAGDRDVLKIVTTERPAGGPVLHLEGQIIGPWVDELRRTCEPLLKAHVLTLDLSDVSFVERRGVELLRALGTQGVPLLHCSAFVAELLKAQT